MPLNLDATILVVDGDRDAGNATVRALRSLGFTSVHLDTDLATALWRLDQGNYHCDLLLTEIHLDPGTSGDGLELLAHARPRTDLKILVVSGDNRRETVEAAIKAGAAAYLLKPFSQAALQAQLEKLSAP